MSCFVQKDCKGASDIVRRIFDLTWFCARQWRSGMYVPSGTCIRARPLVDGGEVGSTGFEYAASVAGYTGDTEPDWPTDATPVTDGSVTWTKQAISDFSLERTIVDTDDVEWDANAPMAVSDPQLNTSGSQVQIAAMHAGGSKGRRLSSWADVTFSDGTKERFEIAWKLT